jgi:hypothetical protein
VLAAVFTCALQALTITASAMNSDREIRFISA